MEKIRFPLSGENRYVGIHLPRELYDFVRVQAENNVSTTAATIRGMLVAHLRHIGIVPPLDKGPRS